MITRCPHCGRKMKIARGEHVEHKSACCTHCGRKLNTVSEHHDSTRCPHCGRKLKAAKGEHAINKTAVHPTAAKRVERSLSYCIHTED